MSAVKIFRILWAVHCLLTLILAGSLQAGPQATFVDGGSVEAPNVSDPDAFPGATDNGWIDSWELIKQDAFSDLDAQVINVQPFDPESGAYLQLSYARRGGKAGSRAGVFRRISNDPTGGGIDPLKPYEVRFQFRIDEATGPFTEPNDQLIFSESLEAVKGNPSGRDRWVLAFRGADVNSEGGVWAAFRGSPSNKVLNFGPQHFSLQPGTVGQATVFVDPGQGTWDIEISYDGAIFRASDANNGQPLEIVNKTPPIEPTFLSFRATRTGSGSKLLWSLDNIKLQNTGE